MLINSCNLILLTEGVFMLKVTADTTFFKAFFQDNFCKLYILFNKNHNDVQTNKVL